MSLSDWPMTHMTQWISDPWSMTHMTHMGQGSEAVNLVWTDNSNFVGERFSVLAPKLYWIV